MNTRHTQLDNATTDIDDNERLASVGYVLFGTIGNPNIQTFPPRYVTPSLATLEPGVLTYGVVRILDGFPYLAVCQCRRRSRPFHSWFAMLICKSPYDMSCLSCRSFALLLSLALLTGFLIYQVGSVPRHNPKLKLLSHSGPDCSMFYILGNLLPRKVLNMRCVLQSAIPFLRNVLLRVILGLIRKSRERYLFELVRILCTTVQRPTPRNGARRRSS
ncbi:hypothetical protein B0H12DRAFT_205762 [Mycena haematopus]|nr:hypothetical protein B0H12DRAFT_205762 [Mycena haematopus]